MKILDTLGAKKILILGIGREGQDVLKFLRKNFPKKQIGIADQLTFEELTPKARQAVMSEKERGNCRLHLGETYLNYVKEYDVIIKSPGISPRVLPKLRKNQLLTSETRIFFDLCPGIIIGITGTKGKSTTAKLIHEMVSRRHRSCFLVGNIGKPPLASLSHITKKSIVVYELSSFQLADLHKSPHIAVVLNIFPEHLDWHGSFNRYKRAKANIIRHQTQKDICVYDASNIHTAALILKSKARKIPLGPVKIVTPKRVNVKSVSAALKVADMLGVSEKLAREIVEKFHGLPHRLEYAGQHKGVCFYNDSLATVPQATIFALETLGDDVETLLLGGYDRGLAFENLAKEIGRHTIKTIILFPPSGKRIRQALENKKFKTFMVKTMKEAVGLSYIHTSHGKICLLSPASPSFGLFRDYEERGKLFKKYVKQMALSRL